MPKSTAFYAAARDAIVRYARDNAELPTLHEQLASRWLHTLTHEEPPLAPTVVRLITRDQAVGDVLPRPENTWVGLRLFTYLQSRVPDDVKREKLLKRARFVKLLGRLASSPDFPLDASIDCVESRDTHPHRAFWLELFRAFSPESSRETMKNLERNLIALSRGGRLRFLLSTATDLSQGGVHLWFTEFITMLQEADGDDEAFDEVLKTCGLANNGACEAVDLGVEVTCGTITKVVVNSLFDAIDSLKDSNAFRFVTLRFCQFVVTQPTAMELVGERLKGSFIDILQFGYLWHVRPMSLRQALMTASSTTRRLTTIQNGAVASMIRCMPNATMEEMDLHCDSLPESAAWLAYAFFHVDSCSSVSSLTLRLHGSGAWLTQEWIEAFKRALKSANLERDLAGIEDDESEEEQQVEPPSERAFVTLAVNTSVKTQPFSGVTALGKLDVQAVASELEVVGRINNHVAVVVPGLGVGWTPMKSITSERTEPSRLLKNSQREYPTNEKVTSFRWHGGIFTAIGQTETYASSSDVLMQLLAIIGEPLTSLSLTDMNLRSDHLALILRHCPNLTELHVSHNLITDISPIVEAFEAGDLKLTSLNVLREPREDVDDGTIAKQMTRLLVNSRGRRNTLRQISLHVPHPTHAAFEEAVGPLIASINSSRRLEFVEINMTADASLCPFPVGFSDVAEPQVGLHMDTTLAFLSVVHQNHFNAIGRLDSSLLKHVFTFAKGATARHALLTQSPDRGEIIAPPAT